jgi:uncharacterized membrane protein
VSLKLVALLVAVVLFIIAAVGWSPPRGSLISAGLAFFAASFLVP